MKRLWTRVAGVCLALAALGSCDSTKPVVPASIGVSGTEVTGEVGNPVGITPTFAVLSEAGDPISGVPVKVAVTAGGGTLMGAPAVSGAEYISIGSWTLGEAAGLNEVTITVDGLDPVKIVATAEAGPPAGILALSTTTLSGTVGELQREPITARIQDAFGNPVSNVKADLAVSRGSIGSDHVYSDAAGIVTVSDWIFGTIAEAHTLTIQVGASSLVFTSDVKPGPPVRLSVSDGDHQSAFGGTPVPSPIVLGLVDQYGNPVAGSQADFEIVSGGGSIERGTVTADDSGSFVVPMWTLGRSAVPQTLRATSGAFSTEIHASIRTSFDVEVRFAGPPVSPQLTEAFAAAAARVEAIVTGDLPDIQASHLSIAACGIDGVGQITETIDDLIIYASIREIDGPGKIVGRAGPCYTRTFGGLPVVGIMEFDAADVEMMIENDIFTDVVLHEMLHVLGLGTIVRWYSYLEGRGTNDVSYGGPAGLTSCHDLVPSRCIGNSVPVENLGGLGTAESHWRESTFGNELMTGYINYGGMPLSKITIGALADLGYQVNPYAADLFPSIPALRSGGEPVEFDEHWESLEIPLFELSPSGKVQAVTLPER